MKITKQTTKYVVEHEGERYHVTILHDLNTTGITKIVRQTDPLGNEKVYHVPVLDLDRTVVESDIERVLMEALA